MSEGRWALGRADRWKQALAGRLTVRIEKTHQEVSVPALLELDAPAMTRGEFRERSRLPQSQDDPMAGGHVLGARRSRRESRSAVVGRQIAHGREPSSRAGPQAVATLDRIRRNRAHPATGTPTAPTAPRGRPLVLRDDARQTVARVKPGPGDAAGLEFGDHHWQRAGLHGRMSDRKGADRAL